MKLQGKEKDNILDEDVMGNDLLDEDDYSDDFDIGEGQAPPMEKHKDLLKSLTNFSPYIRDTFNNWLGLIWDEATEKFVMDKSLVPIMNKRGAMWCIGVLKTYVRDNNIITNISHDDYKNIMIDLIPNIWLNLGTRPELGIKNHGDLLRVCNEMQHSAELMLMGAGSGKYNDLLQRTVSRNETINLNESQKNKFQNQEIVHNRNDKFVEGLRKKFFN